MFEADKGMDNDTIIVQLPSTLKTSTKVTRCLLIIFANSLDPDQA